MWAWFYPSTHNRLPARDFRLLCLRSCEISGFNELDHNGCPQRLWSNAYVFESGFSPHFFFKFGSSTSSSLLSSTARSNAYVFESGFSPHFFFKFGSSSLLLSSVPFLSSRCVFVLCCLGAHMCYVLSFLFVCVCVFFLSILCCYLRGRKEQTWKTLWMQWVAEVEETNQTIALVDQHPEKETAAVKVSIKPLGRDLQRQEHSTLCHVLFNSLCLHLSTFIPLPRTLIISHNLLLEIGVITLSTKLAEA